MRLRRPPTYLSLSVILLISVSLGGRVVFAAAWAPIRGFTSRNVRLATKAPKSASPTRPSFHTHWVDDLRFRTSLFTAASSVTNSDDATPTQPATAKSSSTMTLPFTHADITWKLRPEESASRWRKLHWWVAGILLRLVCRWQKRPRPRLLFPVSGQAVLVAYHGRQKVGRFGITTVAGPVTPSLIETVQSVYNMPDDCAYVRAAAIIYMFVEPQVRGRSLGALALEAIGYMHAARGCDYTILVANDKSNQQSLVKWYEQHGYSRAPALQAALGSPDGIYGVTMIAPTKAYVPDQCVVQWW